MSGSKDRHHISKTLGRLCAEQRGAALVELAFALPIVLLFLSGIVTYGFWFWTAHSLQQAANDAARATIAGVDAADRARIADASVTDSLLRVGELDESRVVVTVDDNGAVLVVRIAYDASDNPTLAKSFLPLPDTVIRRSASVRLAGL